MSTLKTINIVHPSGSPTNLVLGNDGSLTVANTATFSNTITVTRGATFSNTIAVTGAATFSNTITATGTVSMGSSFKRNRIINGNMAIAQRGTTATVGPIGVYTWCSVDRWAVYTANPSVIFSQLANAPAGFRYCTKMQRPFGATGTSSLVMCQGIEAANCNDLSGKQVTLSFWARAGANFTATSNLLFASVTTSTTADQSITGINAWAGRALPINSTVTLSTSWTKYTLTGTFGSGVLEVGVEIGFSPTGTAGTDDSVYITGVQLEEGSVATPYEMQIYSDQLAQCQRYYYNTYPSSPSSGIYTGSPGAGVNSIYPPICHPVPMRSTPDVTPVKLGGGSPDCTLVVYPTTGYVRFVSATTGNATDYNWSAVAEL
jgi:hypothetical protein